MLKFPEADKSWYLGLFTGEMLKLGTHAVSV